MQQRFGNRAVAMHLSKSPIALFLLPAYLVLASAAAASVLSTFDAAATAAFQSGRTVLNFDELVVPPGPCYVPLDRNQYAAQGILISAMADGTVQTHLAQIPGCGHFGPTQSPPNIIGGGTGPNTSGWRSALCTIPGHPRCSRAPSSSPIRSMHRRRSAGACPLLRMCASASST